MRLWAAENYYKENFLNGFTMKATMCILGYKMKTRYMNLAIFHLKKFPHFWQPKTSKITFFLKKL
jgi:hypothetical protein